MYNLNLIDGVISIAGGIYAYLAVIGKIQISKDAVKSRLWIEKYGPIIKILAPLLVLIGLLEISRVIFS